MRCTGLAAPRHVGSSRTRARPVSPALAGGFFTTAPPGKPQYFISNPGSCKSPSHLRAFAQVAVPAWALFAHLPVAGIFYKSGLSANCTPPARLSRKFFFKLKAAARLRSAPSPAAPHTAPFRFLRSRCHHRHCPP